jgi:outer membrane protein assembly factor BamD (BamD/ComL family)
MACGASGRPEVVVLPQTDSGVVSNQEIKAEDAGNYTEDARSYFAHAEELVRARDLDKARAEFTELKRRFSYSRSATLAELRIADIDFALGDFDKASAEYSMWAHDHRSNELLPAALARAETAKCRMSDAGPCKDNYDGGI